MFLVSGRNQNGNEGPFSGSGRRFGQVLQFDEVEKQNTGKNQQRKQNDNLIGKKQHDGS